MSESQTTITYTDPRYIEGDPFEVARQAVRQAEAALELSERAVSDAEVMARNADLERQLYTDDECYAASWPHSVQGRQFQWALDQLALVKGRLAVLRAAASFNPRRPPES